MTVVRLLALSALVGGCAQVAYTYAPTTSNRAAARPAGCDFDILTARPDRRFVELGVLDRGPRMTTSVAEFRTAIQPNVCAAGGDAVLAEVNGYGVYVRGTVIKYESAAAASSTPPGT